MPRLKSSHFGPSTSTVAARLIAERQRLGLSQEEAAAKLGMARGSYKSYEQTANPQLLRLIDFVRVLGMDLRAIAPELFEG